MSTRRVTFITPEDVENWCLASTHEILRNDHYRHMLSDYLRRTFPNRFVETLLYIECFQRCQTIIDKVSNGVYSDGRYLDDIAALINIVPTIAWENRIFLIIDMYEEPQRGLEMRSLLNQLQHEMARLIELEPEYNAARDELIELADRQRH